MGPRRQPQLACGRSSGLPYLYPVRFDLERAVDEVREAATCAAVTGSVVIGEEAAAEDPSLLRHLSGEHPVWPLDPLDGTGAFASGSPDYGVMAALVVNSETVLAIIHQPEHSRTLVAEHGAGAYETESGRRLAVRRCSGSLLSEAGGVVPAWTARRTTRRTVLTVSWQPAAPRFGGKRNRHSGSDEGQRSTR